MRKTPSNRWLLANGQCTFWCIHIYAVFQAEHTDERQDSSMEVPYCSHTASWKVFRAAMNALELE